MPKPRSRFSLLPHCRLVYTTLTLAVLSSVHPAAADTGTALGTRTGEGSGQFTGLAKAPEANLFNGALSSGVTIAVPPGRRTMTPQLTMQYSSSAGPGPFGYGWDLPIGRIERSTKWGVPNCRSHTDDFVLTLPSGAVELLPDPAAGPDIFRPKVEEAYIKAQRFPASGANYWEVWDRGSGMKYTFGKVDSGGDSARVANHSTTPLKFFSASPTCEFTTVWALTKIEDGYSNISRFSWTKDLNTLYPAEIRYGANSTTISDLYKVTFTPVARPAGDQIRSYRNGVEAVLTRRVSSIVVESLVPTQTGVIRTYTLSYNSGAPDGYQSLLVNVSAPAEPTLNLTYSPSAGQHNGSVTTLRPSGTYGAFRSSNSSSETYQSLLDMNGDGHLDLVRADAYPAANKQWAVWFGSSDTAGAYGFSATATLWNVYAGGLPIRNVQVSQCGGSDWSCGLNDTFDLTGDGIPDQVKAANVPFTGGMYQWQVYKGRYSTSTGWGFETTAVNWPSPREYMSKSFQRDVNQDLLDMNGDGRGPIWCGARPGRPSRRITGRSTSTPAAALRARRWPISWRPLIRLRTATFRPTRTARSTTGSSTR